ncbi:hypothetical protein RRG08_049174 [Elysia crispata]|uniref:Uncharacterized protein n=1 Tax=Elysia crispata TaxID=231223 RepID=A0AAE1ARM0_9GAST|nr:hypothetical protein RRG08_049174 [Elysia crispata]
MLMWNNTFRSENFVKSKCPVSALNVCKTECFIFYHSNAFGRQNPDLGDQGPTSSRKHETKVGEKQQTEEPSPAHSATDTGRNNGRLSHSATHTGRNNVRLSHSATDTGRNNGRLSHSATHPGLNNGRLSHSATDTGRNNGRLSHSATDTGRNN